MNPVTLNVVITDVRPPSGGWREIHLASIPSGEVNLAPFTINTNHPDILDNIGVGKEFILALLEPGLIGMDENTPPITEDITNEDV